MMAATTFARTGAESTTQRVTVRCPLAANCDCIRYLRCIAAVLSKSSAVALISPAAAKPSSVSPVHAGCRQRPQCTEAIVSIQALRPSSSPVQPWLHFRQRCADSRGFRKRDNDSLAIRQLTVTLATTRYTIRRMYELKLAAEVLAFGIRKIGNNPAGVVRDEVRARIPISPAAKAGLRFHRLRQEVIRPR
jgi:hypothetical protein